LKSTSLSEEWAERDNPRSRFHYIYGTTKNKERDCDEIDFCQKTTKTQLAFDAMLQKRICRSDESTK
jgi:hypothetical protein